MHILHLHFRGTACSGDTEMSLSLNTLHNFTILHQGFVVPPGMKPLFVHLTLSQNNLLLFHRHIKGISKNIKISL